MRKKNLSTIHLAIFFGIMIIMFLAPSTLANDSLPQNIIDSCGDEERILRPTSPPLEGSDIEELQLRLEKLGFFTGKITGIYDTNTVSWVKKFQKENNIAPTGWVTQGTWKALAQGIEAPTSSEKNPPEGIISIEIHREKQILKVLVNNKEFKTYPVAVGKNETPTPIGEWKIVHKDKHWGTGFGSRWMGLNVPWGKYGIHGTNKPWSIGTRASKGCIRMYNKNVEELYNWVPLGTTVTVIGNNPEVKYSKLQEGSSSTDVINIQKRLREAGFYWGLADGRYGKMTELSVKYFQIINGLETTGIVDKEVYTALGF